ncbi:MAG: hypothetical protein ABSH16_06490 [Sedimentisphaerales bacterium]
MKTKHQQLKTALFAVIVIALGTASQSWGVTYKAIDLHPSGFPNSLALSTSGTQQVGWGYIFFPGGYVDSHAFLWNGSAESSVDLNPSGFYDSQAYGTSGTQQVGVGDGHALLWNGSAESYVDLNPEGFDGSMASGISGTQQVGGGSGPATGSSFHALLWSGSAENYIDLHPSGFDFSEVLGTNGSQQVGWGQGLATDGNYHALLWNGTAASCVDLNPSGFDWSIAYGISGAQQVGYGYGSATNGNDHALLWSGSAEICIDLHPNGFDWSVAEGISGTQQVGAGSGTATGGFRHALLWNGSADSYIDLHQFLPTGFDYSGAIGIDSYGNIVGYAYDSSFYQHAILWQPILLVADAGPDQTVYAWIDGIAEVNLDGSGSYDEDGDELTYSWSWTIGGNNYDTNGVNPTIELPVGQHVISLIVNDGTVDSEPNEVNITVVGPIEANLCVSPKVINCKSFMPRITAMLRLPKGITRDEIDINVPLVLYPGQIEADKIWISRGFDFKCRAWNTTILASFDKDQLMDAIDANGVVELAVVGQLKTGQYFFGTDDIIVICPCRWPWHHWPPYYRGWYR